MNKMTEIEKFFLPPCRVEDLPKELRDSGERPILYLLRRDLEHLYLKEDEFSSDETDKHKAPYLATMGILTGIDLLSKFYLDKEKSNGKIFKYFLINIGEMNENDASFMWDFRNALHHSYSLYIKSKDTSKKNIYFSTGKGNKWHTEDKSNHYIFFWELKRIFLELIKKYKDSLEKDDSKKELFIKKYKKNGRIYVKNPDIKSIKNLNKNI